MSNTLAQLQRVDEGATLKEKSVSADQSAIDRSTDQPISRSICQSIDPPSNQTNSSTSSHGVPLAFCGEVLKPHRWSSSLLVTCLCKAFMRVAKGTGSFPGRFSSSFVIFLYNAYGTVQPFMYGTYSKGWIEQGRGLSCTVSPARSAGLSLFEPRTVPS